MKGGLTYSSMSVEGVSLTRPHLDTTLESAGDNSKPMHLIHAVC